MLFSNFGNPSSNPAPRLTHQVREDIGVEQKSHPLEINRVSRKVFHWRKFFIERRQCSEDG
jgi:hypothetical protein